MKADMLTLARCMVALCLLSAVTASARPEIDQPAPALRGTLFSGHPFDLQKMRGKVAVSYTHLTLPTN